MIVLMWTGVDYGFRGVSADAALLPGVLWSRRCVYTECVAYILLSVSLCAAHVAAGAFFEWLNILVMCTTFAVRI